MKRMKGHATLNYCKSMDRVRDRIDRKRVCGLKILAIQLFRVTMIKRRGASW